MEKMHEFSLQTFEGDGVQSSVRRTQEVIRNALNQELSSALGSKKSKRRRATVIARMVFERSDYDCSNSVDFPEFLEFVVTLISAIFIAQLTEQQQQQQQNGDIGDEETLNAASFRQMLRAVFGSDVLLKAHERKYQGKADERFWITKFSISCTCRGNIYEFVVLESMFRSCSFHGFFIGIKLFKCLEKDS